MHSRGHSEIAVDRAARKFDIQRRKRADRAPTDFTLDDFTATRLHLELACMPPRYRDD